MTSTAGVTTITHPERISCWMDVPCPCHMTTTAYIAQQHDAIHSVHATGVRHQGGRGPQHVGVTDCHWILLGASGAASLAGQTA